MPGVDPREEEEFTPAGPANIGEGPAQTFGQAAAEDQELADKLLAEEGDPDEAAGRFEEESIAAEES